MPRILIADDDPDTRQILTDWLTHQGYETFAAADGQEALAQVALHPPDVALVDVWMPGPSGAKLVDGLKEIHSDVQVIIITAYGSIRGVVEAMKAGAFEYLEKPLRPGQVLTTVEKALAERAARGQSQMSAKRASHDTSLPGKALPAGALTRREKQVLCLIVAGLTNREIAARLTISVATVKRHISNLYKKLDVCNRAQAIRRAREWELTDPRA